ncbi:MAG: 50S ribosomal protein L18 [Bacillota bacterium]|nr:50S ribosomal protein L18 [Bacillota bacterium]
MATDTRREARKRRHFRVRRKVYGTPERPRLSVFRSGKHIYAQVVDDTAGHTLVAASSLDPALRGQVKGSTQEGAEAVGKILAQRALEKGIAKVVFDRGGYRYHGRIKALADGARAGGLEF